MNNIPIYLQTDMYKTGHQSLYPESVEYIYSNFTFRNGALSNTNLDKVVFVGITYYIKKYLAQWRDDFFNQEWEDVEYTYREFVDNALGRKTDLKHLQALHKLGHLPLKIKALPEGSLVPYGVPCITIENTHPDFAWLTNYIETSLSAVIWAMSTSASTAFAYRLRLEQEPSIDKEIIPYLCHDFSYRGMFGGEAAAMSGFGHLCCFSGSDNIPAAVLANEYYGGSRFSSVAATEHSVMCAYGKENEFEAFEKIIENHRDTIVSIVSDTWDFWNVVTKYLPKLKDKILYNHAEHGGKVVIRPDSGDPVKILTGDPKAHTEHERKGLIEMLYDIFGGEEKNGLIQLNPAIGAVYGDSITLERQDQIITRLVQKGFIPDVVLGIGSYSYQYVTRDTHSSAIKATHIVKNGVDTPIFKDPKTGQSKKSAKGYLHVEKYNGNYIVQDNVSREKMCSGELRPVHLDRYFKEYGDMENNFHKITDRINQQIKELINV